MSLATNLLNSLENTSVEEVSPISQDEGHIVVDETRRITVPKELQIIAVTGDKDIETVTFDCVRFWDDNDLSTFAIYLNYVLPDKSTGTYIPEAINTSEGDNFYHFDWNIKNTITQKSGKISFAITAIKTKQNDEGETVVDKQWSSLPNADCTIAVGLDISNVPDDEESAGVLAQMSAILEQIHADVDEWIKTALVQTTGSSETKAMSQKATTIAIEDAKSYSRSYTDDESAKLEANIQKNNQIALRNYKQIENLKNGIKEQYETDYLVAYVKDIPSNALPYAEIKKIGGMTYNDAGIMKDSKVTSVKIIGANIIQYNKNSAITNGITFTVNKDGSVTAKGTNNGTGSAWFVIPIGTLKEGETYYISGGNSEIDCRIYAQGNYNGYKNQSFIYTAGMGSMDIEIYVTVGKTVNSTIYPMLHKGPTELPFSPYTENLFPIPESVQNLDGYGQGNPNNDAEFNSIIWKDEARVVYSHVGNIVNGSWVSLPSEELVDISDLVTSDNLIEVEPFGTLRFENEYAFEVPSEVEYQLEV